MGPDPMPEPDYINRLVKPGPRSERARKRGEVARPGRTAIPPGLADLVRQLDEHRHGHAVSNATGRERGEGIIARAL